MKNLIKQLFLDKNIVVKEIEVLQSKPNKDWVQEQIDAKHDEWDRIEHKIELFFIAVGMSDEEVILKS